MDLGLRNKIALVAASSHGLGRAVAEELAAEGASLIICGRNTTDIEHAASQIRERTGIEILEVQADVSRPEDVARLVEKGTTRFGRIDIFFIMTRRPPRGTF